ncbi:MAG: AMP-binding protein, partial [Dehalococcoidia bacterium]|nr:AMP-binding protein [Dehalococcoidia bacterium]
MDRSARVFPDKPAVIYDDRSYTYSEFDRRITHLAGALVKSGIVPGDRIAYLVPNIPQMLEGHYAPMRMGGILVAINTRLSSREIGAILRHSGARVLVFDSEHSETVEAALSGADAIDLLVEVVDRSPVSGLNGAIEYEQFLSTGEEIQLPEIQWSELDTVAIDYTSGTTGEPKGVEYTGRGAYLNALGQALDAGLSSNSAYLWTLPMFHCNGWCYTWAVTAVGGTHICLRKVNADDVFSLVAQHAATHMCAAPSVLTMLETSAGAMPGVLDGVRIFTGGAPPAPRVLRTMRSLGAELHHLYGLTETYGPTTLAAEQPGWHELPIEEQARMKSRQGVPTTTSHVGVRVVDETMSDVPADAGTIGEVVTRGNTVMAGYYKDPEASETAFAGGWFHTGDLMEQSGDGYLRIVDRKKEIYKNVKGQTVAPQKIENL